jgi:two-component system sensor histidine kinase KdpD
VARHPQVAVVDEFPHTNIPGSKREKRWEDVFYILDQGIDVLTTMNVQHLESLNDQMVQITGIKVRETIPDWVVKQADEVVMVDLTPRALLNRLERGVVYPPEKARRALENFFRESSLVALREMALRQTAHEVEERLGQEGVDQVPENLEAEPRQQVPRRLEDAVIIYVSDDPSTAMLIRRGRRVADVIHAKCFAVCVADDGGLSSLPQLKRQSTERHLDFARNMHIDTAVLTGRDHAKALVDFARTQNARQIFLPRVMGSSMDRLRGVSLVNRVVSLATDMEVTIVADRRQRELGK